MKSFTTAVVKSYIDHVKLQKSSLDQHNVSFDYLQRLTIIA